MITVKRLMFINLKRLQSMYIVYQSDINGFAVFLSGLLRGNRDRIPLFSVMLTLSSNMIKKRPERWGLTSMRPPRRERT